MAGACTGQFEAYADRKAAEWPRQPHPSVLNAAEACEKTCLSFRACRRQRLRKELMPQHKAAPAETAPSADTGKAAEDDEQVDCTDCCHKEASELHLGCCVTRMLHANGGLHTSWRPAAKIWTEKLAASMAVHVSSAWTCTCCW